MQTLGKEVGKTLVQLYRSFSRAAALVPTAETNICCEELCAKILAIEGDWKSKVWLGSSVDQLYDKILT